MTAEFAVAVHALVFLNHKRALLSSEALAENICTNPACVRRVMSRLKACALVDAKEGKGGGYAFTADPHGVTLRMVLDAMGQEIMPAVWRTGDVHAECTVSSGMGDILELLRGRMNNACLDILSGITIADIDGMLFPKS